MFNTKLKNNEFLIYIIAMILLFTVGFSIAVIGAKNNTIEELRGKINEIEQNKPEVIIFLDKSDNLEDKVLVDIAEKDSDTYLIKNELMYRNKNITEEEASYKSILIYITATNNNVDPFLLVSMGLVESNLRHLKYRNNKNAIGMFQITPIIENKYNADGAIFEENVKCAAQFISKLLDDYDGNKRLALAHYNGGVNPQYKIKNYPETRNYVSEVFRIYEVFKNLRQVD